MGKRFFSFINWVDYENGPPKRVSKAEVMCIGPSSEQIREKAGSLLAVTWNCGLMYLKL